MAIDLTNWEPLGEICSHLVHGRKIMAIKAARTHFEFDLKDAKELIDFLWASGDFQVVRAHVEVTKALALSVSPKVADAIALTFPTAAIGHAHNKEAVRSLTQAGERL